MLFESVAIRRVRPPQRHGGKADVRHALGQRQKNRHSFYGTGIHQRDEFVLETPQRLIRAGLEQRNRNVLGRNAAPLAYVVRGVLADPNDRGGAAKGLFVDMY